MNVNDNKNTIHNRLYNSNSNNYNIQDNNKDEKLQYKNYYKSVCTIPSKLKHFTLHGTLINEMIANKFTLI